MGYLEFLTLGLYDWVGFLVMMTLIWAFFLCGDKSMHPSPWILLIVAAPLAAGQPLTKIGRDCPTGYFSQGDYCTPMKGTHR